MGPRRSVLLCTVLLCVLALCCAAPALALEPAGDGWYWQSPQPQGNVLNAVAFSDPATVWAVGDGGTIMQSADGGATWHLRTSPVRVPLGAVTFTDPTHGWIAGGEGWAGDQDLTANGVILATADGGATWSEQASFKSAALSDLTFIDDQQGWAVGGRGLILRTTDGGQTWVRQKSGVRRAILSVAFADAQHGYAGCAEGLILTTADGGATWQRRTSRSLEISDVTALAVGAGGKIWAAVGGRNTSGNFPRLWSSTNGGRTWRYAKVDFGWAVWDLSVTGDAVYAVGPADDFRDARDLSRVLVSHDGGTTWAQHVTGAAQLSAIASGGGGTLCAVGDITVTSADDGATWSARSNRGELIGGLDMVGPTEAWAVGNSSFGGLELLLLDIIGVPSTTLLHTTDGARWQEALSVADERYMDVDFADPAHGWVVGNHGLIRHTADGGVTWDAQTSGTTTSLALVAAPRPDAAWAFGYKVMKRDLRVTLLRTADAGATWTPVTVPTGVYPFAATAASADDAWLAGIRRVGETMSSVVLRTVDGGTTWSRVTLPLPSTQIAFPVAIDFVDATHGWLTALNLLDGSPTVFATGDGGATWSEVANAEDFGGDFIVSLSFIDASEGWASGTGIFHTTDGGRTWARQVSGSLDNGFAVDAYDAAHALAAGYGLLSTVDTPGDTAPPMTLRDAAGGWTRSDVAVRLTPSDIGISGLASTEYSVDGGAWTSGLMPPAFLAPADHSGDGSHTLSYRSTDNAGNVEPAQGMRVRIDTVKPVSKVGRAVIGRDGVLRMRVRIDDRSCPSVADFGFGVRTLRGDPIGGAGWEGFNLRTNRWVTLRDDMMGDFLKAGVYRIVFFATDRAGNQQARYARGLLTVKPHKMRWPTSSGASGAVSGARASYDLGAARAGAWAGRPMTLEHASGAETASRKLIAGLRRLVRLTASGR